MPMQKIINDPNAFVDEMLEGVLLAHPEQLRRAEDPRVVVRADAPRRGKVGIVTGGGSGHLPVFLGYVGFGLADGVAVGNVFASPSSEQILEATREVNGDAGVLYLYGNYSGDVMNFDLAAELAEVEGIGVATVLAADDVASAPKGSEARRRGIAGIAFLYKLAGARAEEGASLADVVATSNAAAAGLRSMGVALSSCVLPAAGQPTFSLPEGEMEIGMGIHGEPGVQRGSSSLRSRSPSSSSPTSSTTCPTVVVTKWRCWSTGSGQLPRRSFTFSFARFGRSSVPLGSPCGGLGSASTPPRWRWRAHRCRCCASTTS